MRFKTLIHRPVLAAAALAMAACTSHETQTASQPHPSGRPGGPGMKPDGQRAGPNGGKPKPPPPAPNMSPDEAMNRIDANKDGAITLQEQVDFSLREADMRFSKMDRDHDGRLTSEELSAADKHRQSIKTGDGPRGGGSGGQQPPGMQSLLTRADANHDGAVDVAENRAIAQQQASKRFQTGDKNGDGRLERSEMQKPQAPGQ